MKPGFLRILLALLIALSADAQGDRDAGWKPLFDGASLKGWRETPFTRHGSVTVGGGAITLGKGLMTGITRTEPFPHANYEIRLEAMRVEGSDFFAGITFPVHDSYCTWINGGWGGMLVGLSSLDGNDASENDTRTARDFANGKWYALRLRVTDTLIQAWIDDEVVIDVDYSNMEVGLRPGETELSAPMGIASYSTTARLRHIEFRFITSPEGR